MATGERIGDILVARGLLDRARAETINAERVRASTRFGSVAVNTGRVDETEALKALALQQGVPAVDLHRAIIPKSVVQLVPIEVAVRESVLPLRLDGGNLFLAMANPGDARARDEISFATGLHILPYVALHRRLVELTPHAHSTTGLLYIGPGADTRNVDPQGYVPIIGGPEVQPLSEAIIDLDPVTIEAATAADIDVDIDVIVDEPLATRPATSTTSPQQGAGIGKTILVVDDEPEIQRLVVESLRPLGGTIITASRGDEALLLIKQRRPDLIVLDAMLPEVHGFEICRKVKESRRFGHTPVLMISAIYRGWRMAEDIKTTYRVDEFLEKPFRVAELRRHAERLLQQAQPTRPTDERLVAEAQSLYNAGVDAYQKHELVTAFERLRDAERIEPFSAKIHFMLARVLEKNERPFQAIYHYERAVELKPAFFAATKSLAELYQASGFRNKAVEMWERSLRAAPSPDVRDQIKQHLVSIL